MTTSSSEPAAAIAAWHPPDLASITGTPAEMAATVATEESRRIAWMDGHASAMAQRESETAAALSACHAAIRAMHDSVTQLRAQVSTTVHALAVAIARHLLERELSQDTSVVQHLVLKALALAPMSGAVTVRLNPVDLAALQALGVMPEASGVGVDLRWVPDEAVIRGGCLVESPTAIIDGRIDRALLDIYEQISHD